MLLNMGINAEVTIDPVFLLNKNKWIKLAKPFKLPKKYVLVYVLDTQMNYLNTLGNG